MAITAQMVKELRERTGVGMMECKKALQEVGGDIEAAIEHMRKTGLAKADKKAHRTTAEGCLVISKSADRQKVTMLEANCETDFVAMGDDFQQFAQEACRLANEHTPDDIEALSQLETPSGESIEDTRRALVAKIGENMVLRRFVTVCAEGNIIGTYLHGKRIGVITVFEGGDEELAYDIAMHIAAFNPPAIDESGLSQEALEKERAIHRAKAEQSGKPDNIIEKMVEGAMRKYFEENTLLGQRFLKDDSIKVADLLQKKNARIEQFIRYELGEGIEVEKTDFASEVMAQAHGK